MDDREFLLEGFKKINVKAGEEVLDKLISFHPILLEWNEKINLTTIVEKEDVYIKHFIDSATCISTGFIKEGAKVIDVGTGAGFPGIPIKLLREDITLTLLDSLNKRILYLNDVISRLDIKNVDTIHARAEEGGANPKLREKYDVALSRAVATLNVLLEYCMPFVKVGGYFICQKGPSYEEELIGAKKAMEVLGAKLIKTENFLLPYSDINHTVLIFKKIRQTTAKYPRKPGKPASDPIV